MHGQWRGHVRMWITAILRLDGAPAVIGMLSMVVAESSSTPSIDLHAGLGLSNILLTCIHPTTASRGPYCSNDHLQLCCAASPCIVQGLRM